MKIIISKIYFTLLFTLLILSGVTAQHASHPWNIGLGLGLSEYNGDYGNGFFKFQMKPYDYNGVKGNNQPGVATLNVARFINEKFDVAMNGHWGEWGYFNKDNGQKFYRNSRYIDANLRWKFLANDQSKFIPYAMIGLGMQNLKAHPSLPYQTALVVPIGLGINIDLTKRLILNLQTNYGYTTGDNVEGATLDGKDMVWNHQLNLCYVFGKAVALPGDADGDGVNDKRDLCANTPKGALIDKKGCIVDGDKDGVADNLDKCPSVAGLEKFSGCPDTDNDGVQDSEDKCPSVAGVAQFSGCPDMDADGIQDSEDACPQVAGTIALKGCPDADGDGIADNLDKCPNEAGIVANEGCPEVKPTPVVPTPAPVPVVAPVNPGKATVVMEEITHIKFETNSFKITDESITLVDMAIAVLKNNPSYQLVVEGYTDNTGSEALNMNLSRQRANAVKKYLVGKGVNANRITTVGYGMKNPKSDNSTTEGRLENRRAELKAKYKAVK